MRPPFRSRFGSILLPAIRCRMSAKHRKRSAVPGLRDLADEVGAPVNRRTSDLRGPGFEALRAQAHAACATEDQRRRVVSAGPDIVFKGAGTAHGQARAPRACQIMGCGNLAAVAMVARAPRTLFFNGAGTAHGQARAPRARRIMGCGNLPVVALLARVPQTLFFNGAGTAHGQARVPWARQMIECGNLPVVALLARAPRTLFFRGAGTATGQARAPRARQMIGCGNLPVVALSCAGTPDIVF